MVFRNRKDEDRERRRHGQESRRGERSYRSEAESDQNYYNEYGLLADEERSIPRHLNQPDWEEERNRRQERREYLGEEPFEDYYRAASSWSQPGPYTGIGPKGYRRSDERIREEVQERLMRHGRVDASEIEVEVQDGEVTLLGTVNTRQEKRMAEDSVEDILGVLDIHNRLKVRDRDRM